MARLKAQLAKSEQLNKELLDTAVQQQEAQQREVQRLADAAAAREELLKKAQASYAAVFSDFKVLRDNAENYKKRLLKLNSDLSSETFNRGIDLFSFHHWITYPNLVHSILIESFPESDPAAQNAVVRARERRAQALAEAGITPEPADPANDAQNWTVAEHLAALSARVVPLKQVTSGLLTSAIKTYSALWPGLPTPVTVGEMGTLLEKSEERLEEWKESAARIGADAALEIILSWYEDLEVERFRLMRSDSKWSVDPGYIQRRQELANSFIEYTNVSPFRADPREVAAREAAAKARAEKKEKRERGESVSDSEEEEEEDSDAAEDADAEVEDTPAEDAPEAAAPAGQDTFTAPAAPAAPAAADVASTSGAADV